MKRLLLCFAVCALAVSSAFANDTITWGQLGPNNTLLTTAEPWTSTSGHFTGLVGITGSFIGTQNFQRTDQSNGWAGNFTPGDALLWNQGGTGDIGVQFNQLVSGGGAHIQADFYGAFTATLTAYDSHLNVIGSTTMNGISNGNADGSAIFINFLSGTNNIFFLNFHVVDIFGGDDFAIDTVNFDAAPSVPEPSSILLLGSGLLGIAGAVRRRLSV